MELEQNVKKRKDFTLILLVLEMLLCNSIIYFTMLGNGAIASKIFTIITVLSLILFARTCYKKYYILRLTLYVILYCILSILYSWYDSGRTMDPTMWVSFGTFMSAILYFAIASECEVKKKTAHFVLIGGIMSAFLYPFGYYIMHVSDGSNFLTLGFSNPNLTGMYIAQSMLYLLIGFFVIKKIRYKAILVILFVQNYQLLQKTEARNAIFVVLFAIVVSILAFIRNRKQYSKPLIYFISIFPFVFAMVYLYLINLIEKRNWFSFLVSEGKSLHSRQEIWMTVIGNLEGIHWLVGDYFRLRGNMHNTHMTLMGSYGIIGMLFIVYFMYYIMCTVNEKSKSYKQAICLIGFFGTIIMGMGEAALFYGSMGMYVMACSYLILARYNWDEDKVLEENDENSSDKYDIQGQEYRQKLNGDRPLF